MSNITPFPDKNGPDPEFVHIDERGHKMFFFAATYAFAGNDWSVEFWAQDMAEAQQRLQAMRESVGLKGCFQILAKIDA